MKRQFTYKTAYFNSKTKTVTNFGGISQVNSAQDEILHTVGVWISEGSGWTIDSVSGHFLNISKYKPLKGSSYIKLPEDLRNPRKGLVNIKNIDDECFRWCHLANMFPADKDPQRVTKYIKHIHKLDYSGVTFPVKQTQYEKIEKQNNINVNVFGHENGETYPIHISRGHNSQVLNLLLLTEGEKWHYVLIKNFDRFMYGYTKHREKKHFCMHCLQCFASEQALGEHKAVCILVNGKQAIEMPKVGSVLKYENHHKQLNVPFVIYADFEAIVERVDEEEAFSFNARP